MAQKTIIITPKDKEEAMLLQQLIKRMGLTGHLLTEEEMEDAGLALAMSKVDRTQIANKERVMKKLRA